MMMGVQPAAWAARRVTRPMGPAPLRPAQSIRGSLKADLPDEEWISEPDTCPLDTCQSHGERLAQRAFLERDGIGELVYPAGGVRMEPSEGTVVRRCRKEHNAGT